MEQRSQQLYHESVVRTTLSMNKVRWCSEKSKDTCPRTEDASYTEQCRGWSTGLSELCSNLGSKHQLCDMGELLRALKLVSVGVKQAIICRSL